MAHDRLLRCLPREAALWASEHLDALEAIYAEFSRSACWPDPIQLQRKLRALGRGIPIARISGEMPRVLGWRDTGPDRVVLGLFGIACCEAGQPLLEQYVAVLRLALAQHDRPHLPNRLSRATVVDALALEPLEADRLSSVILGFCPFLASGDAGLKSWDLEIHERVVDFEHITSVDDLLSSLAAPHEKNEHSAAIASVHNGRVTAPSAAPRSVTASLGVLGLGANALAVFVAPPAFAFAVIAASVTTLVLFARWPRLHIATATTMIASAAAAGAMLGLVLPPGGNAEPSPAVSTQLDSVLAHVAREKRYAVIRRKLTLHGDQPSHLLVIRDEYLRDRFRSDLASPMSDEIRIYDEVDGQLRLRLRFQPQNAGEVVQRPEGDAPSFLFRLQAIEDYNGDGKREVVGAFERYTLATGPLPAPTLISWDDGSRRYRLNPLIPDPPILLAPAGLDPTEQEGYKVATKLQNQHGEQVILAHGVDAFDIVRSRRAPVFMTAYAEQTPRGFTSRYEVKASWLDLQSPVPRFIPCGANGAGGIVVRANVPGDVSRVMRDRVLAHASPEGCDS